MTSTSNTAIWNAIEKERSRDRIVRRASMIAWAITFIALAAFSIICIQHILLEKRRVAVGVDSSLALYDAALPLVATIGVLSTLVATLCTVGVFLRLRTASLSEIQLRLAALEEMLRTGGTNDPSTRIADRI